MIESVQARQRGAYQFEDHYDNLCALQDSVPLTAVKAHLGQGVIDLNGDRIRLNDWGPIINTIKINKSLQFIAVRSYYQVSGEEDEKRSAILRRKLPSIRSKEITHRFCKALKECLFVSPTLSCIELQGVALRDRDLQVLVKGILKSQTLRHLSLESCRIGDQGLEILCKGLKNSKNINSVNLSGCSLSYRGADALAGVVKHQGMQRHNEAWRDSLRYRRPDLDRMAGLRRITINNNPMLGDEGARMLAEALKDDLWLKALDLQGCGMSTLGARSFLDVLKYNTTLVVLDLRRNPLVDRDVLHSLMEQLMLNSNGDDGEYKWMKAGDVEASPGSSGGRGTRRTTKVLNSNVGKKTTIKIVPIGSRRKPKVGVTRVTTTSTRLAKLEIQPSPGLPWRTAARANRFRGHPPDGTKYFPEESANLSSNSFLVSSTTNINNSHTNGADDDKNDDDTLNVLIEKENASTRMNRIAMETADSMQRLEQTHLAMDLSNKKQVLIELEQMRRQLREERLSRARGDQRIVALMMENRRLSVEVEALRKGQKLNGGHRVNGGLVEDEKFLENIENSFKQFHSFIDMLKEAGLGQLVTMAGIEQTIMPFPSSLSSKTNNNNGSSNNFTFSSPKPEYNQYYSTGMGHYHPKGHASTTIPDQLHRVTSSSHPGMPPSTSHINALAPTHTHQSYTVSSMGSFPEEASIVIGGGVEAKHHHHPKRHADLEDSKDTAKKEADEVYSRLLHDTHGSLGQGESERDSHPSSSGHKMTTGTFQSTAGHHDNEDDEDDDIIEEIDANEDDTLFKHKKKEWDGENVSYNQSSFISEHGDVSQQEREDNHSISRDEDDGSDNDDF